ncbi:MAG TPA: sulfatase-like hydrolase/transferase, partial [Planctomycetota bacterium]|nr:sulfatase-like hydrolase/transferase [Planctomycetota bacterium]
RKTAFVDVQSAITDQWPGIPRVERDRAMTDNLVRTISTAEDRPFFAFGFYDASHSSYIYPPEHGVFTPVQLEQSIDFIEIAGNSTVENLRPLANRYRNALHYVDAQVARVLAELERRGLLDRTMVFITGDHGQEFGELGYYGHNGSFNRYQTQTAFVAHIPGLAPGPIDRLTSHIDVVPTILANLGISAPINDYAQGLRLDRPAERDHVVTVGWDSLGLVDQDVIMVRGLDTYNLTRELFDRDYHELPDTAAAMSKRAAWMPQLIQELGAFRR